MKIMKKILASISVIAYLMVYAAPITLAVTPTLAAGVNKPVLRAPAVSQNPEISKLKLEGDIAISKGNPKITLSLRDSDVQQVLRMFADKAGLNIVFHDSVTGKVTLDLVNMPLNDAFKLVLQVTNLTYFVDNNTMVVTSAQSAKTLSLAMQQMVTIPVKYIDSFAVAEFLNKNIFSLNKPGLSNGWIATTNPATNEVILFGTENDIKMAKKVIDKFDVKPKETVFTMNHTTPKEMAAMICGTLLALPSLDSGSSGSGGGASTGGAADAAGGDSSSSDSSGGGSISLGAGIVACQFSNRISVSGSESGGGTSSAGGSSGSSTGASSGGISAPPPSSFSLSSFLSMGMTVSYFPQRGTISVLGGTPQQLEMIKEFIQDNDKKQPQAYLELSIIELNETGSREFSNSWQIWSEFFSGSFTGSTSTNPWYPTFFQGDKYDVVDSTKKVLYSIQKYTDPMMITYAINYLIKNDKGRVLANPRIMITNGQPSTIDLSSDYVKSVKSEVLSGTGGVAGAVQRTYEIGSDDGIKVSLEPFISPDGYVTLNIKPEYATIKEQIYVPTDINGKTYNDLMATLLQRRNLDLKNVRIRDGETLVIGGMMREHETKGVSKIPVLGELPGVGFFFRNSSTTKEKQELVIMITPKIIKDNEDVVKNTDATL